MIRVAFVEMMGVPGSYDASVYDHYEDRDREGLRFARRFGGMPGLHIFTRNVCTGEALPGPHEVDALVLAGSYNSVHDHTSWQEKVREWLPGIRRHRVPLLAICGSHQLLAHTLGAGVETLSEGPFAGTLPVTLTPAGAASPLFLGIESGDSFHYANNDHVLDVPDDATLLASSSRVPVAALDYGHHCYSAQFHPEGTEQTLATVWRFSAPERMQNYHPHDKGRRLVENFLRLAVDVATERRQRRRIADANSRG